MNESCLISHANSLKYDNNMRTIRMISVVLVQELEVVVGGYILICCLPMTIPFYFLGHSQIFIFSLANPPHNLNFTTRVWETVLATNEVRYAECKPSLG